MRRKKPASDLTTAAEGLANEALGVLDSLLNAAAGRPKPAPRPYRVKAPGGRTHSFSTYESATKYRKQVGARAVTQKQSLIFSSPKAPKNPKNALFPSQVNAKLRPGSKKHDIPAWQVDRARAKFEAKAGEHGIINLRIDMRRQTGDLLTLTKGYENSTDGYSLTIKMSRENLLHHILQGDSVARILAFYYDVGDPSTLEITGFGISESQY